MNALFREIAIWKQLDRKRAVKFNCLENLRTGEFAVLHADFHYLPAKAGAVEYFHKQFIERFIEMDLNEGITAWFTSIEEAISHHEAEFS
jgi:hypothetical protein